MSATNRTFYGYDPDANRFAAVGFAYDEKRPITAVHWSDEPFLPTWKPRPCHVFDEKPLRQGDFPSLVNYRLIPVMTERAWIALRPLIGYCCEALPIIHPSGNPHFIIHVMNTIDALDVRASEVSRDGSRTNRIDRIYKYAFHQKRVKGHPIFKLPIQSSAEMFVDDEFRRIVEVNRLRGLLFNDLPM